MSRDIRELLDGAIGDTPPARLDSDSATGLGRRALGRRRAYAGGGALAGVAAAALAVTLVMNTVGGGHGSLPGGNAGLQPSASDGPEVSGSYHDPAAEKYDPDGDGILEVDMPVVTLPQVDEANPFGYGWNPGFVGKDTPEADAYGEAFWAYLERTYPGHTDMTAELLKDRIGDATGVHAKVRDHTAELVKGVSANEAWPTGDVMPIYLLEFNQNGFSSDTMIQLPGEEHPDGLGLAIYPVGGFTTGVNGVFDLAQCEDYEHGANGDRTIRESYTCGETTGPNGELVRTIRQASTEVGGGGWAVKLSTILYRADGTAVVVTDGVEDWAGERPQADPVLDHQELLALAAAMPDTVVK